MAVGDLSLGAGNYFSLKGMSDECTIIRLLNEGTGSDYTQSLTPETDIFVDPSWEQSGTPTLQLDSSITFNIDAGSEITFVQFGFEDGGNFVKVFEFQIGTTGGEEYLYNEDGLFTVNSLDVTAQGEA